MSLTKIHIDRLALDGDGIGRLEAGALKGQAAFVPYTLPQESVEAMLLVQKKNHSRWIPVKILKPSSDRITPRCPLHFTPGKTISSCGGCDWQHMTVGYQLSAKKQLVIETLERLGGLSNPPVRDVIASPEEWRYRNKVQVPFGREHGRVIAGFYAPGSHEIVEFEDCLIQPTPAVELTRFVTDYANKNRWVPYDEDRHKGWIRHLLLRLNEKGEGLLVLVTADPSFPAAPAFVNALRRAFPWVIGVHQNLQKARSHVVLGEKWRCLWGARKIEETVLGIPISFSPGSFFQINKPAAEKLFETALEMMALRPDSTVMDLYCGVGALTLAIAKRAGFVIGVEFSESSIRDAKENAYKNRIKNVKFVRGDVGSVIPECRSRGSNGMITTGFPIETFGNDDLVVMLDPPRSGCDRAVLDGLLRIKPERIVYISCHPATLARDLKILSAGYRVVSVAPVDLFPQTSHIECVVKLEIIN